MELSAASRLSREPVPDLRLESAERADTSAAPDSAHETRVGSFPPIKRAPMAARPWLDHPLRYWIVRWLGALLGATSRRTPAEAPAPWQQSAARRRRTLLALVMLPTIAASYGFAQALPPHASGWLPWSQIALFTILFAWISAGFWTALMGFVVLARGGDRHMLSARRVANTPVDPQARTAIIMPICNEHVATVFAGLRATCESVAAAGGTRLFDFYILSDTTDPDLRTAEVAAWNELVDAVGGRGRIFYRWRQHRTRRKAGNVADFCRRWGRDYRYLIVLDADSVMSGDCALSLVRLMEAHPRAGIIQTAPRPCGRDSLHARLQQFAARMVGPLFTVGMQFWQLGESHYWGHNAIIRVQPFMQHCGLARLPGHGSLGGEIMSHDFVEAALMRRAGYHVWIVPDLDGSYEQVPPNLNEELTRDRRWCHGNLQNFRLIVEPGLHSVHRAMLATGALAYVSAFLSLLFSWLSTLAIFKHGPAAHFWFGSANRPMLLLLLVIVATMLFLPKVLAVALALVRRTTDQYGGGARLIASALIELVISFLYTPIRMLFHTKFVLASLTGLRVGWKSPPREDGAVAWRDAARLHALCVAVATAWLSWVVAADLMFAWWLAPLLAGWFLSVPLAVVGGHVRIGAWLRRHGLLLIPEESALPAVLRRAHQLLRRELQLPSFVQAVTEPRVNSLVCAASGRTLEARGLKRQRSVERVQLAADPALLSKRDRLRLLSDPLALSLLQQRMTLQPEPGAVPLRLS
jgi:membrane glycosyltransferase